MSWELVHEDRDKKTERLAVPGGWIYTITEKGVMDNLLFQTSLFIPYRND